MVACGDTLACIPDQHKPETQQKHRKGWKLYIQCRTRSCL